MRLFQNNPPIALRSLIFIITLFICPLMALENKDFTVTDAMKSESRYVIQSLEKTHYNKKPISQLDTKKFIDNYIDGLDLNHLFLLQPQVDQFHTHFDKTLLTFLKQGNIYPAFEIFKTFKNDFHQRITWVLSRLEQPFDFSSDDTYIPVRKDLPFPIDEAEANKLWEKRLKFELLSELLSEPIEAENNKANVKKLKFVKEKLEEKGNFYSEIELFKIYKADFFKPSNYWVSDPLNKPFSFSTQNIYISSKNNWLSPVKDVNKLLKNQTKAIPTFEEELKAAIVNLKKRYEQLKENIDEIDAQEIQEIFLTNLAEMYDPHSSYFSAETLEEFSVALSNSLVGIGATLTIEDNYCTIKELITGGPAERSKELKPNDKILSVAQGDKEFVDVIGMKLKKTVRLIRGEKGTPVRLLIQPADGGPTDKKIVTLTRDEIRLTSNLAEAKLYEMKRDNNTFKIGVIEIPSFYASNEGISYYATNEKYKNEPSVTRDVSELITKLKKLGMQGLVLDLRYNGGGLLPEAITLTGLFIPIGPVVHVRNAEGQIREYIDTNPEMLWKGPLLILTSKFSASASEIFAGALKSYHRAFIVGDSTTHGKGTVQLLSEINKPITLSLWSKNTPKMGATKFTVQKWYLPDGSSTQLKGVPSDILIPSINEHLPIAEADLSNPLPWDAIHTIPWTDESIESYADVVDNETLKKINKMSIDRQNSLEEFSFLKDTIEHFRKKRDQKEFSLNLATRKSERANDSAFTKNMEAWLDKLSTNKFELQDIRLNSAPSKPNANDNNLTDDEAASKTTLAKFDIYKREGIRIMSDYIELQAEKNPIKLQKEISE